VADRPLTVDEGDTADWHVGHALRCLQMADEDPDPAEKVRWLTSAVWDLLLVIAATDPAVSHAIAKRAQPHLEKILNPKKEDDS